MSRQMQAKSLYDVSGQDLHKNIRVLDLRMDSRLVQKDDLFFALSLDAKQRAQHIDQAVSQGCSAVVVDAGAPLFEHGVLPVVAIKNLRSALGEIANNFYDQPSSQGVVVGITGTNGKTSCSHWMAQAWSAVAGSAAFMGTLGSSIIENGVETTSLQSSGLTTADVLSNHRVLTQIFSSGAKMVAMEVSSHALDQGRVDGVGFDTAVFSNLTRDHLDYHGDMERYGQAKQQLFLRPDLKHAIVNIDDVFGQYLLKIIAEKNSGVRRLSYAVADKTADICVQ
jgi:UDP-N-acetylmuramoyl-L-alanyl-D-glutamate--2,6-diaminopimelate ligase